MSLSRGDPFGPEWHRSVPQRWRRWLDVEGAWLRLGELSDDDAFVVKAELPGIDPADDVPVVRA